MIQSIQDTVTLNNGVPMHRLGFGTMSIGKNADPRRVMRDALDVGYRHFDTAMIYHNEDVVGEVLRESGVRRQDIFLTTKCWNQDMRTGRVLEACDTSLKTLGMDYIDLYLLHWAVGDYVDCWMKMQKLLEAGKVRAIGVSNFVVEHLDKLLAVADVVPAVNQIEFHPYLQSPKLVRYCEERGIIVEAWEPLVAGKVKDDKALGAIGETCGKTAAQVALRWELQRGTVTIPRSTQRAHIEENADLFDFALSDAHVAAIDAMDRNERQGPDPTNVPF